MPEPAHLSAHHRDTLLQIFHHPTSHNIEWHDVLSLLEATAEVEERHDGKYHVTLGEASLTMTKPSGKDVDVQQVLDLRTLLRAGGYESTVATLDAEGKEV